MNIKNLFEMVFPILLVMWIVSGISMLSGAHRTAGKHRVLILMVIASVITIIPLPRLSIADYVLSVNPVFSIGNTCLMLSIIWKQEGGRPFFSEPDLLLFSTWNIAVSLYLYLSHLGFIGYDLYSYGYGFSPLFVLTAFMTIFLFLFKSPVYWIFIAYIFAYDLRLLHSNNFFDYITDGALFIVSVAILIKYIVKSIVPRPATDKTGSGS